MNRNLMRVTFASALAGVACLPLSAVAQEHDDKRSNDKREHATDAKSRYGEVPSDFYQREWLWVDRGENYENVTKRLGKPAPKFVAGEFVENSNDKGMPIEKMKGKIVLIDFWATWCGPCIKNIPHTNEIAEKYRSQGVEVIGICNTDLKSAGPMPEVSKSNNMMFPTAWDTEKKTATAYGVKWWPYYVIIDRDGNMQAAGVKADKIEEVLESLLKYQPASTAGSEHDGDNDRKEHGDGHDNGHEGADTGKNEHATINAAWLEGKEAHRDALAPLTGNTPPALSVSNWINANEMSLQSLQGKVVMLDFWATWCGPCIRSIPHTNELQAKYKDDGLVIIGVCHPREHEKMAEMVDDEGIEYPVAADVDGKTIKAFAVDSYPDYYFIDRAGKLRVADCNNGNIEDVIKVLLAEKE